jgi:hypothetical protein
MATSKRFTKVNETGKQAEASAQSVIIRQPEQASVILEVTGTASAIQNCFSQKAVDQILRKHMGLPNPRELKNARKCIEWATTRNVNGEVCFPPTAFKKGMLTAAMSMDDKNLKKTRLRTSLYIVGQSIPITFDEMEPRMDVTRTSGMNRQPDIRFRPEFKNWKARMEIQFDPSTIKVQTVVDLLGRAGRVGVGEWRPEKDGSFGTYEVTRNITDPKEIAEVRKQCAPALVALRIPEWALDADIDPELLRKIAHGEPEDGEEAAAVGK